MKKDLKINVMGVAIVALIALLVCFKFAGAPAGSTESIGIAPEKAPTEVPEVLVEAPPGNRAATVSDPAENPVEDSDSAQGGGRFPFYGQREVLPGVKLEDLVHAQLDADEVSKALKAVLRISYDLTQEVYRTNPEVREAFLSLDEAIDLRVQGFLIMKGNDPKSDGGTRFFVCPPDRLAQLSELKTAAMLLYDQPSYLVPAKDSIMDRARTNLRGTGELALEMHPDGTGMTVWNDKGEFVSSTRFNIPGLV
ncbi:MAG: hypothetical protein KDB61_05025, partial [Planctomycetes bacterium]|nr:hypothetical protein [Planctomycetota bacterium]